MSCFLVYLSLFFLALLCCFWWVLLRYLGYRGFFTVRQLFLNRLGFLQEAEPLALLNQCLHGVERECLRVTLEGKLAQTSHPVALGSPLTNERITTDYAEALLEFVTPAEAQTDRMLAELRDTHAFVGQSLEHELLWSSSMPCPLPDEKDIPIARYGSSLAGQVRHIYRRGLAVRYGKTMQCIAGIHYNFSLPDAFWSLFQQFEGVKQEDVSYRSAQYIALIRNFRRFSWLLMYLFGASPALDASFLKNYPNHQLERFDDDTFYLPFATSLRMSDLGYQSNAQSGLTPCYDDLSTYIDSLSKAISTPYPTYEKIGTKQDGEWIQLNTNILQIENEYYSSIRPKRVVKAGERPIQALRRAGIQYVEVRCMDINPFLPMGIDESTSYFLNSFLLYCAMFDSPIITGCQCHDYTNNFLKTVKQGRDPQLMLRRDGEDVLLTDWARTLLDDIGAVAEVLDKAAGTSQHSLAVQTQFAKLADPQLLPSARVLASMRDEGLSFAAFSLAQSRLHQNYFSSQVLEDKVKQQYQVLAEQSLAEQQTLEQDMTQSLEAYIANYVGGS